MKEGLFSFDKNKDLQDLDAKNIESIEEVKIKTLKTFRFRHGQTLYTEVDPETDTSKLDLTPQGEEQIKESVQRVIKSLEPKTDIVLIVSSPRTRAVGSATIAAEELRSAGFEIYNQLKNSRHLRPRLRAADTLDNDGKSISKEQDDFKAARMKMIEEITEQLVEGESLARAWARLDNLKFSESFEDVKKRAREELDFLFQIRKYIKVPKNKKLVIFSFEHGETLDELIELATDGENTFAKKNGLNLGEPVELNLNFENNRVGISFPLREIPPAEAVFDREKLTLTKIVYNEGYEERI